MLTLLFDEQAAMAQIASLGEAVPTKLAPAQAAINATSDSVDQMTGRMAVSSRGAVEMGEVTLLSGEKVKESMYEARGEAALLGEQFGIHLPRHVRSFIAELPGVGQALSSAFEATAILFVIQAIIQAAEKMSAWVSETFIFTEAMKASNASIAATNKAILEQVAAYGKAQKALEEFGLTGSALTQSKINDLTESINKNKNAVRAAEDQLYGLRNGFVGVTGEASTYENKVNQLTATIKTQTEQLTLFQEQHDAQQTAEVVKAEEERIAAVKTASQARISVAESEALLKLAITGGSYSRILAVENKANEDQLNNQIRAIALRISALTFEGDKTKGERQKLSADIEKLIDEHNNKIRAIYAKAFTELRQLGKEPIPLVTEAPPGMDEISNAITKGFQQADAAAKGLGITLQSNLHSGLAAAYDAYDKLIQLQKVGIVTQRDVDKGYVALVKAELNFALQTGASSDAVRKLVTELRQLLQVQLQQAIASHGGVQQIQQLQKAIQNLDHDFGKSKNAIKEWEQALTTELAAGASAFKLLEGTAVGVIANLAAGMNQATQEMVAGTASAAQAMERLVAKAVASMAQYWGAFFIGKATADIFLNPAAAAAEFAAGAALEALAGALGAVGSNVGGSKASSSASAGSAAPAANSPNINSQQPSQVVNVTHLASGGLVTGPTLAVIGDSPNGGSSREAVIPLDNGPALKAIASAITAQMKNLGNSGGVPEIHLHGSLSALVTEITYQAKTGRIRLHATTSDKTIRKA
ncbi:MAG: hypothetical protein JWN74_2289 [Acidobacteriaceae bacterium]|nr:hypothetical protein [Acidobacteriaceae bacterium]